MGYYLIANPIILATDQIKDTLEAVGHLGHNYNQLSYILKND